MILKAASQRFTHIRLGNRAILTTGKVGSNLTRKTAARDFATSSSTLGRARDLRPFWLTHAAAMRSSSMFSAQPQRLFSSKNDDDGKPPQSKTDQEIFEEQKKLKMLQTKKKAGGD